MRVRYGRNERARKNGTHTRNLHQSATTLGRSRIRLDPAFRLQRLRVDDLELRNQHPKAYTSDLRHAFIGLVGDQLNQLLEAVPPFRRDDAVLCQVPSDRIR